MLRSAVLLALFTCQDHKLAAELKELPGDAKKPPTLVVEGTTDLPDGAILKLNVYFGPVRPGEETARGLVQAKDGKYSKDFQLFGPREKNVSGTYHLRVHFDPNLQPAKLQSLPAVQAEAKLEVGDALTREKEHAAIRKRLADDVRAIHAIGGEVQAKFAEAKGKPDPKAWAALQDGWRERILAVEKRAGLTPEYRHLGLYAIADAGLENLREIVLKLAACAARGEAGPLEEGKIILDRAAQLLIGELTAQSLSPRQLRERVEEARKIATDALGLSGDALAGARRQYVALTLSLGQQLGEKHHDTLGAMADAGRRMFDAIEEKKADAAKTAQAEVLRITDPLLQALQDPK
jgi:hypothetical protein